MKRGKKIKAIQGIIKLRKFAEKQQSIKTKRLEEEVSKLRNEYDKVARQVEQIDASIKTESEKFRGELLTGIKAGSIKRVIDYIEGCRSVRENFEKRREDMDSRLRDAVMRFNDEREKLREAYAERKSTEIYLDRIESNPSGEDEEGEK